MNSVEIDLLADLKGKFLFLTFMTEQEILDFLSMVDSIARETSVNPDEILCRIERQSCKLVAHC